MTIRIGRWDCSYCGHIGNLGPSTKCENCGATRPPKVKFYLPENAKVVTNEDEIRKAKAGADWVCSFCGTQNKITDGTCYSCGNDRQEEDGDKSLEQKEYLPNEVPRNSKDERKKILEPPKKGLLNTKSKKIGCGCLSLIVLALAIFAILSVFTEETSVKVAEKSWEQTINAELYKQVQEEDWILPSEGKLVSTFNAIHHYDKVFKGYETKTRSVSKQVGTEKYVKGTKDLGNGHFQDVYGTRPVYKNVQETYQEKVYSDVPIYQKKYKYLIYRWIAEQYNTNGIGDNPLWYDLKTVDPKYQVRSKDSTGVYSIKVLDDKRNEHLEKIDILYWKSIKEGENIKARKSSIFGTYYGLEKEKSK
jgi:hypothetical protein